jgi:hypothetical protein
MTPDPLHLQGVRKEERMIKENERKLEKEKKDKLKKWKNVGNMR